MALASNEELEPSWRGSTSPRRLASARSRARLRLCSRARPSVAVRRSIFAAVYIASRRRRAFARMLSLSGRAFEVLAKSCACRRLLATHSLFARVADISFSSRRRALRALPWRLLSERCHRVRQLDRPRCYWMHQQMLPGATRGGDRPPVSHQAAFSLRLFHPSKKPHRLLGKRPEGRQEDHSGKRRHQQRRQCIGDPFGAPKGTSGKSLRLPRVRRGRSCVCVDALCARRGFSGNNEGLETEGAVAWEREVSAPRREPAEERRRCPS